jgi:hypothetical protein
MPQLDPNIAKEVAAAESDSEFEPVPDGTYTMILANVEAKMGPKGPYWTWEFRIPSDAPKYANRAFWTNTSLSEQSRPFLKRMFDAFGVPADTNTELLCGRKASVVVGNEVQAAGERAGQIRNTIVRVTKSSESSYSGADGDDDIPW